MLSSLRLKSWYSYALFFLCPKIPRLALGGPTQYELNHSLQSTIKVRNEWSHTSSPHIRSHGVNKETYTFLYCFHYNYS